MAATQTKTEPRKDAPKAAPVTEATKSTPNGSAPATKANWEKKLTTKLILDGKKVHGGMVGNGPVQLYTIIGVCTGIKTGESQYGGWVGFTGSFEAVRISDGIRFNAPVAFIPEPASGMTLAALTEAQNRNQGPGTVSVRFAFIVGAKPSDKAAGFEYYVEPVMQASENDALSDLRALMAPRVPALTQQ